MSAFPTLFVSHGSPMLALQDSPARRFLQTLGQSLPRPRAIAMVSAHWESLHAPAVSLAAQPETLHDFGGFPPALYELTYPAPGAPAVAEEVAAAFETAGIAALRDPDRGLDHGAWVPLRLMIPDADVPVLQISVLHQGGPAAHWQLGQALSRLRQEGILLIGSGSLTHNLYEFRGQALDAPAPAWVTDFADWMHARLESGDTQALLNYRSQAPWATRNHPSEEHLMPLFVALGAAGTAATARRLHASVEHGVLAMDVYAFS